MSSDNQRWDPATYRFVVAILRVMIGMAVVVIAGGYFLNLSIPGLLSGAALAIVLYLVAMHAGNVLVRTRSYSRTLIWLIVSQFILWVGMALLLAAIKVNPIGFVVGVSILPVAILVTLAWYALRRRWMPS